MKLSHAFNFQIINLGYIKFLNVHLYIFVCFKILSGVLFKSFYIDYKLYAFYRDVLPKVTEEKTENFISGCCLLAAIKEKNLLLKILQCTSSVRSFGLQFCGQLCIAVLVAIPVFLRIFVY